MGKYLEIGPTLMVKIAQYNFSLVKIGSLGKREKMLANNDDDMTVTIFSGSQDTHLLIDHRWTSSSFSIDILG